MRLRGLILAAGAGSRLERRLGYVKILHRVKGVPLLCYPLSALTLAGAWEVVVATRRERVGLVTSIARSCPYSGLVDVVPVETWWAGNAWTLLEALEGAGRGRWLVSMADHIFTPTLASAVAGGCGLPVCIGADPSPMLVDVTEATKILARGGRVVGLGKGLPEWTHVDVGVHLLEWGPRVSGCSGQPLSLNDLNLCNAARGLVGIVEVPGEQWVDVDTPEDLDSVERGAASAFVESLAGWLRSG